MARQSTGRRLFAGFSKLRAAAAMALASSILFGPLATHSWAQTTIETCVNTTTKVGRFAPKPSSGGGCNKKEKEVTLDTPGPAGPQGPAGLQGPAGPPSSANAFSLTGSAGTHPTTNFLGTTDSQPLQIEVNGVRVMSYQPAVKNANNDTAPNVLGGDSGNIIEQGIQGATIAGGGGSPGTNSGNLPNSVKADFGTVGGGSLNTVIGGLGVSQAGLAATVAGGVNNVAGTTGAELTTGFFDGAFPGQAATVGGGVSNEASGVVATVTGGSANHATGNAATVAGGLKNQASGDFSFVAGANAAANNTGSFVWSDTSGHANKLTFSDSASNSFNVRATGGLSFATAIAGNGVPVEGCQFDNNGNATCTGVLETLSDRTRKDGFEPVAASDVLKGVAALPISTWTFKDQKVRHVGPMAQDFYAAFKLGADDKHISATDAQGVALAAIQGLYRMMQAKDAQIAHQKKQLGERAQQIKSLIAQSDAERAQRKTHGAALSARLDRLERATQAARAATAMHPASAVQPPLPASITGF